MPKLLDRVSEIIRIKHYSYRTEKTYKHWIKHYILYHNKTHPEKLDGESLNQYLTHLLYNGYDIKSIQELLGHKDVRTTMIYTNVMKKGPLAIKSPLDN